MYLKKHYQRFLEIEKEYNLFENFSSDDVPLWFLIRFEVWTSIILFNESIFKSKRTYNRDFDLISKVKLGYYISKRALFNHSLYKFQESDFLYFSAAHRYKISGKYFDVYSDFLLPALDSNNCLTITNTLGKEYHPYATKNIEFLDSFNLSTYLKSKIHKRNNDVFNKIVQILRIFCDELNINIDLIKEADRLYYNRYFNFEEYKKLFSKLLPRIKPLLIFEISHYGAKSMAMNVVAHTLKIPTVELQHGTINYYNIGYNYPLLNKQIVYPSLPKYIFLFGDYWKPSCNLPIKESNKIVTGFPFFEFQKNNFQKNVKRKNQILFLSQWTIGEELAEVAYDLAKLLPKDYQIIYKLHPAEDHKWQEKYANLLNSQNIYIADQKDEKSLYDLFTTSKIQVGVYSTALYEGLGFGLKTFIVRLPGYEYLQDLIDSGYVNLIDKADEIVENLNSNPNNLDTIKDQIWKPNALNNMVSAINKIIS